jgi:transposase
MNLRTLHLFGASGRRFLDALVAGERSPRALAALGDARLKATPEQLADALTGRFRDIHAFEIGLHLRLIDTINGEIARLDDRIQQQLASIPGVAPACTGCGLIGRWARARLRQPGHARAGAGGAAR